MSKTSNPYASKAMLVLVGFSKWEPRKYDKKASKEVTDKHGIDPKAARVNKRLFVETPASLKAIYAAMDAAADTYYNETLPWSDDGCRLLPVMNYDKFTSEMRAHQTRIDAAVRAFVPEYPNMIEAAKAELKDLWNEDDYPASGLIADRFAMVVKTLPVPLGQDFRVSLADKQVAELQKQIDQDTASAFEFAIEEAFGLLFDAVEHLAKMLTAKDPKRSIKDVLIDNTASVAARVKRLNLSNDKQLIEYADRIIAKLCSIDGQTLRDSETTRATVTEDALTIKRELAQKLGIKLDDEPAPEPQKPVKKPRKEKPVSKAAKAKASKPVKAVEPEVILPKQVKSSPRDVDAIADNLASLMGMTL